MADNNRSQVRLACLHQPRTRARKAQHPGNPALRCGLEALEGTSCTGSATAAAAAAAQCLPQPHVGVGGAEGLPGVAPLGLLAGPALPHLRAGSERRRWAAPAAWLTPACPSPLDVSAASGPPLPTSRLSLAALSGAEAKPRAPKALAPSRASARCSAAMPAAHNLLHTNRSRAGTPLIATWEHCRAGRS